MSTYVMSDIHGNYEKFMAMLEKIHFSENDSLFLNGDVLDRGEQGFKILQYTMLQPNIFGIIGNHEFMAIESLKQMSIEIDTEQDLAPMEDDGWITRTTQWLNDGGRSTINEFSQLTEEEKEDIFDYVGEFSLFEELTVNGRKFILVHAGITNFSPTKKMNQYRIYDLIFDRADYSKTYFPDKYLVTGHTPTRKIFQQVDGISPEQMASGDYDKIFKRNNNLAIDCGCAYGGRLGCICLDDLAEFYV